MALMHRTTSRRIALAAAFLAAAGAASAGPVYRCPGNTVSYTDQITPLQARERGCKELEGAPVTVVQPNKPRPVPSAASPAAAASRPDQRVDPKEQRERDADARRILEAELRKEEDKLAGLEKEFNNGEPERRGDEKNFQRYLDRVEELKQSIARKKADIAAIKRELSKFGGASVSTAN
jgi:hypothetical protein